jgi:hypothetical protein
MVFVICDPFTVNLGKALTFLSASKKNLTLFWCSQVDNQ